MGARNKRDKRAKRAELLLLKNDLDARSHGPHKKKWSKHDIRSIKPLTDNQHDMFRAYFQGSHICAHGSPGTGKTYLALFLALCDILDGNKPQNHLILVRSAVATRDVGFLPGTLEEKMALYEMPYRDIFADLFGRSTTYDDMKDQNLVRFMTTSFIRGLTWDNAIIVVDEGQNMTWHEINSVLTRVGINSRIIFTGDLAQTDLTKSPRDQSGMERFVRTVRNMAEFASIEFTKDDIVRSDFVRSWIIATELSAG